MAKAKQPLGHADDYPYPSFAQAQSSFGPALKIVTGQASDLSLADKGKTLHTVGSFALSIALPHTHEEDGLRAAGTASADADPDCCALKAWAREDVGEGVRGWSDWLGLGMKILAFLADLLKSEGL